MLNSTITRLLGVWGTVFASDWTSLLTNDWLLELGVGCAKRTSDASQCDEQGRKFNLKKLGIMFFAKPNKRF